MLKPSPPSREFYPAGRVGDVLFGDAKEQFEKDMQQFTNFPETYGGAPKTVTRADITSGAAEADVRRRGK